MELPELPIGLKTGIGANFTLKIYVFNSLFLFYRILNGTAATVVTSYFKAHVSGFTKRFYYGKDPLMTDVFSSFILPVGSPLEV